jgi:hypothetical protein
MKAQIRKEKIVQGQGIPKLMKEKRERRQQRNVGSTELKTHSLLSKNQQKCSLCLLKGVF